MTNMKNGVPVQTQYPERMESSSRAILEGFKANLSCLTDPSVDMGFWCSSQAESADYGGGSNSDTPAGTTPLMMASAYGRLEAVRRLLRAGADIDALDEHGHNALFWALRWDKTASARELMRCGSKLTDDALCGPVRNGNALLVQHLIKLQANPNAVFRRFDGDQLWPDGETLLGFAVTVAGILDYPTRIIELLVRAGADVNQPTQWFVFHRDGPDRARGSKAVPPLQVAASRGMGHVMKMLWRAGASS